MLKWCLSFTAAVGLCALLTAQVPGGGSTSLPCDGQPKSVAHPAAAETGYGTTAAEACTNAQLSIAAALTAFGMGKCGRCPGGPPHCGGGTVVPVGGPPFTQPQFDPIIGLWTCLATLPPGTITVTCNQCPD